MSTIILEKYQISPSPLSPYPDPLPLTYFDNIYAPCGSTRGPSFYNLPYTTAQFLREKLGPLKTALALALGQFRPLAGTLHHAPSAILCSDLDTVSLVVAESDDDFSDLCGLHARDCARFHPLVPRLTVETALVALQVTIFPGKGVCLGIAISHVVADGPTTARFLHTWAGLSRGDIRSVSGPSFDRSLLVMDPNGRAPIIRQLMNQILSNNIITSPAGKLTVRATLAFSRKQLEKLKCEYSSKTGLLECSSFALVYGVVLASLVKAKEMAVNDKAAIGFVFDGRARHMPPLPAVYFGNCLGFYVREVSVGELAGVDCWAVAAKEVWAMVNGLKSKEPEEITIESLRRISAWKSRPDLFFTVSGSPRLGFYQLDFGWGRPLKVELINIEGRSAMSVLESGEDGRGLEVGIVLSEDLMAKFTGHVADLLSLSSME